MSDPKERILPWNKFWNFLAKEKLTDDEAKKAMKKIAENLNNHLVKELGSQIGFVVQLQWYYLEEIPNLYRAYATLIVPTEVNEAWLARLKSKEFAQEPYNKILDKAGSGSKPPTPPNPPGPKWHFLMGDSGFIHSFSDIDFKRNDTIQTYFHSA
jgi:hypothetical protein